VEFLKKNGKWLILGVLLVATILIWYVVILESPSGELKIYFLNIGQGDATLIEAPNGNQMLIDGGPDKSILTELGKILPFYDRKIDVLVATHPDQDHVAGLTYVLDRYKVERVLEPGVSSETAVYQNLEKKIMDKGVTKTLARRGMTVDLGSGAVFKILFPDRDVSGLETNSASIVGRVVYGDNSVMLTGDSPKSIESYLVSIDGQNLKSDILKAGHHGSKTSSSDTFVGFVSPTYAVVSVGEDNRYGHPNQEILDLFKEFEISILRTDESGTIGFKSDGSNFIRI